MPELFKHGYALLIGVGADLPVTVKDAEALYNVLIHPNRAAYPPEQVKLLTEKDATRKGILEEFNNLIVRVNQDPDATAVVYFSGHGGQIEISKTPPKYYLVPYGYDPDRRLETSITGEEFTKKIEGIKARKLIVLLDCCHAGGIPVLKGEKETFIKSPIPPELNALEMGSGRVVVTSSRENEVSYTGDPNSVFTAVLLEALAGKGAASADGYARILQVLSYLFEQVPKRAPGEQHPFVKKILDLGDNFPLCYYAGGSKSAPGVALPPPPADLPAALTSFQRRQLEMERQGLEPELNLRSQKLNKLRTALAIETNPAIQFQYQQLIFQEEADIARLNERLEKIFAVLG